MRMNFREMARGADSFIEWFNLLNEYRIKLEGTGENSGTRKGCSCTCDDDGAKGLSLIRYLS